ncbi:hypothetical protein PHET_00441 [Paragonimus heterotremus]|uniref:Uncharacterized protein n=1 Tax=Paragonimus heterotremus TaxID=100268 RepID=A0A8J4TSV2_9TREM|nr:hypothetical protein PHET_00441 [Paragonimus heterotremus]
MEDPQISVLAFTNWSNNAKILCQVIINLTDTDNANSLAHTVVQSVRQLEQDWFGVNVTVLVFLLQCVPRLFGNSTLSKNASVQANTSEFFDAAMDLKISLYWYFKYLGWNSYDYNVDVIRLSSEESLLKLWINESQVDLKQEGHLYQQLEHALKRILQSYSNEPYAWIKSFKLTGELATLLVSNYICSRFIDITNLKEHPLISFVITVNKHLNFLKKNYGLHSSE